MLLTRSRGLCSIYQLIKGGGGPAVQKPPYFLPYLEHEEGIKTQAGAGSPHGMQSVLYDCVAEAGGPLRRR